MEQISSHWKGELFWFIDFLRGMISLAVWIVLLARWLNPSLVGQDFVDNDACV